MINFCFRFLMFSFFVIPFVAVSGGSNTPYAPFPWPCDEVQECADQDDQLFNSSVFDVIALMSLPSEELEELAKKDENQNMTQNIGQSVNQATQMFSRYFNRIHQVGLNPIDNFDRVGYNEESDLETSSFNEYLKQNLGTVGDLVDQSDLSIPLNIDAFEKITSPAGFLSGADTPYAPFPWPCDEVQECTRFNSQHRSLSMDARSISMGSGYRF